MNALADALVLLGCAGLTLLVVGLVRLPDPAARVHATSFAVFGGVAPILLAVGCTEGPEAAARAISIGAFLLFTSVASAHAIGWAARRG